MMTPALSLDFTSAVLDPRITFARTGATATRINAAGLVETVAADTPRFDFNPISLACRGLLVEGTTTNLIVQSSAFNVSPWSSVNSTFGLNAINSPDGTLNATKLIEAASTAEHYIQQFFSITTNQAYTQSIFVKAGETSTFVLAVVASGSSSTVSLANFSISGGVISSGSFTGLISASSATPVGNGWYRCALTYTLNGTVTSHRIRIYPRSASSYLGDGTSGIYIWGAQTEVGAAATSYVPTTTVTVVRNPDIATITGTNFSDWWQASKGGVLVRARPGTVSGTRPWLQFDDGTADNIIALRGNAADPELYIVDGGTPQAQIDAGTIAANTDYSLTGWWATNDCKARLDSGAVVTDTSATIPTVTQARLGSDGTNYLNGHLASISYYDSFSEQIYTRRKNKAVFNLM